jgi:hypothetical protein
MLELITDLEISLEAITKWLRGLGLTVKDSKTKFACFTNFTSQKLQSNYSTWKSNKNTMNVLGVTFDSKLQWSTQV